MINGVCVCCVLSLNVYSDMVRVLLIASNTCSVSVYLACHYQLLSWLTLLLNAHNAYTQHTRQVHLYVCMCCV